MLCYVAPLKATNNVKALAGIQAQRLAVRPNGKDGIFLVING
jgi:hypothetical protein